VTRHLPTVPREVHEAREQQLDQEILDLLATLPPIGLNKLSQKLTAHTKKAVSLSLSRLLKREAIKRTGAGIGGTNKSYRYSLNIDVNQKHS
jgi:predicted transcriptional regulator